MYPHEWLEKNKDRLEFKVKCADYKLAAIEYWDFLVTAKYDGIKVRGRGQSQNKAKAFIKACNELIERIVLKETKTITTSNGLAIHTDYREAAYNATAEAIERDLFLSHYLTRTPWKKIELPGSSAYNVILDQVRNTGKSILFGQLSSHEQFKTVCCVITGEKALPSFGYSLGISTKRTLVESAQKAFQEAYMNSFPTDLVTDNNSPIQHLEETLKPGAESSIIKFFKDDIQIDPTTIELPLEVKKVKLPPSLSKLNVAAYHANSENLQQLYFGETLKEHINFNRLQRFLKKEIIFDDLTKDLHPIP